MAPKKILIITSTTDSESNSIVRILSKLKIPYYRINADRWHDTFFYRIDNGKSEFEIKHRKTGAILISSEVGVVWWARFELPGAANHIFKSYLREFVDEEYYASLIALLACLEDSIPVINHPIRHIIAGHKSYQQKVAAQSGFQICNQLITNDRSAFMSQKWFDNAVFKPISNSQYLTKKKEQFFATVREIDESILPSIQDDSLELYVHHFQEKLIPEEEFRVTAFGNHVMAFRIDGARGFDWRLYLKDLKYTLVEDFPMMDQCRKYMKQLGILFGCFDILKADDKQYYFIECNAPGYFLFLDPKGQYKLAKEFACYLDDLRKNREYLTS